MILEALAIGSFLMIRIKVFNLHNHSAFQIRLKVLSKIFIPMAEDSGSREADISEQEALYLGMISELRANSPKSEELGGMKITPKLAVDEIMDKMEEINELLGSIEDTELNTIRNYVEYAMGRSKSFADTRFDHLFMGSSLKNRERPRSTRKVLDYSFREKLIGFVSRKGKLQWSDDKIDDFIEAIARANSQAC